MDIVPNHCSSEHAWFADALAASPGDPARSRFWFRDGRGDNADLPPNNWVAEFGGSAWTRVTEADGSEGQWYLHTFTPWQPDFDWNHPDVVEHFDRVLGFWFDRGVDGFRVDAIQFVGKAPGLPDTAGDEPVPAPRNPHLSFVESGHDVWRHWRTTVDEYERTHRGREVFLVGEAYTPRRPDLLAAYVADDEFHQAFSFDLLLAPWNVETLRAAIDDPHRMLTAAGTSVTWVLNNHDVQRAVTRYGRIDAHELSSWTGSPLAYSAGEVDVALGTRRARAAAVMVAALPGSLYVYQGEELGLPEVLDLPDDARKDPIFTRTGGAEIGRDGCRVPIPWNDEGRTAFGFATAPATPWLPQPTDWSRFSVARQEDDTESMLALYRDVLRLRRGLARHEGPLQWVLHDHPDLLAFARGHVRVVLNPTGRSVELRDAGAGIVLSSLAGHDDPGVVPADTCLWLSG
jgi:alpha-glucosidase